MANHFSMEERRALFKNSPAKGEKISLFRSLKSSEEAFVEGRLVSKLLKLDPNKGVYSIGVMVFVDEEGAEMKFSSTGKKADRFHMDLEVKIFFVFDFLSVF